jgi:hypothetical protein
MKCSVYTYKSIVCHKNTGGQCVRVVDGHSAVDITKDKLCICNEKKHTRTSIISRHLLLIAGYKSLWGLFERNAALANFALSAAR